jgi:hypothetical protein
VDLVVNNFAKEIYVVATPSENSEDRTVGLGAGQPKQSTRASVCVTSSK